MAILKPPSWLQDYSTTKLKGDFFAGLTVGILLIPQSMAYALIAGLPVIYGLYASLVPQIMYALIGSSRQAFSWAHSYGFIAYRKRIRDYWRSLDPKNTSN